MSLCIYIKNRFKKNRFKHFTDSRWWRDHPLLVPFKNWSKLSTASMWGTMCLLLIIWHILYKMRINQCRDNPKLCIGDWTPKCMYPSHQFTKEFCFLSFQALLPLFTKYIHFNSMYVLKLWFAVTLQQKKLTAMNTWPIWVHLLHAM